MMCECPSIKVRSTTLISDRNANIVADFITLRVTNINQVKVSGCVIDIRSDDKLTKSYKYAIHPQTHV